MAAFLTAANATVTQGFGVRGVEMAATARRAFNPALGREGLFHPLRLRWSSAKLTRSRFAFATLPPESAKTEPWIEAATAQPTKQSNQ